MAGSFFRYQIIVFGSMFVGYTLYVLCRKAFTFVIPVMSHDEPISKVDMGLIVSAQNFASAGSKFFLGILSDKVSSRILFVIGLFGASLSVVGFSSVADVKIYALLWFLNGLAQGCGWPACAKLLQQWFRPDQFGTFWSILASSTNVAGGVVPLFLPFLITGPGSWRKFMLVSGFISFLWAVVALIFIRNRPEDVGLVPIKSGAKNTDSAKSSENKSGFWSLTRSKFLWMLSAYYLIIFAAKTSCENWGQLLVVQEKKLSDYAAGQFLSAFETGGFTSSLCTGYLTDWVVARQGMNLKKNPRMKLVLIYTLLSILLLHLVTVFSGMLPLLGFLLGAALYGNINIFGIVAVECAPRNLSGSSHAVVSLAANLGAVLAGLPLSVVAGYFGWIGVFRLLEVACIGCVISLLFGRNVSTQISTDTKEE